VADQKNKKLYTHFTEQKSKYEIQMGMGLPRETTLQNAQGKKEEAL
jgi:hypothetical protein